MQDVGGDIHEVGGETQEVGGDIHEEGGERQEVEE